jgi:hypothetical protein
MKKKFVSFILLLSLALSVAAQSKQVTPKPDAVLKRLEASVSYLASDKLEGRRAGTTGATTAAGFVANQFAKIGLQPGVTLTNNGAKPAKGFLQTFTSILAADRDKPENERKPFEAYNVIGILPGSDAVLKNEAIVIGAHYDHLGKGGTGSLAANSTEIHHGADDNASGVAGMLELARTFKSERKNRRTLIFIAFGAEEEGLIGSKFYVNNPVFPLDKTVAMVNMDMIGRLSNEKLTIGGIGTASEWNELVKQKNDILFDTTTGYGVGGKFTLQLNEDGFGPSDHSSFYSKQIPVLFFFTGTHLDYHKPTDTADKINYDGIKQILLYVAEIVRTVDKNDKRPTYTVAKSSGTGEGRRGFAVTLGVIPSYSEAANDGLVLDGVRDDSPAAKGGLKAGDKIVKLAGKDVRNIQDYMTLLNEMKAGEEYEVGVVRGSERLTLKVIPAPSNRK